jgi:hypothetical protein
MHESKREAAQPAAAIAALVVLGLIAPLIGVLMLPVVAVDAVARAVADGAGSLRSVHLLD